MGIQAPNQTGDIKSNMLADIPSGDVCRYSIVLDHA